MHAQQLPLSDGSTAASPRRLTTWTGWSRREAPALTARCAAMPSHRAGQCCRCPDSPPARSARRSPDDPVSSGSQGGQSIANQGIRTYLGHHVKKHALVGLWWRGKAVIAIVNGCFRHRVCGPIGGLRRQRRPQNRAQFFLVHGAFVTVCCIRQPSGRESASSVPPSSSCVSAAAAGPRSRRDPAPARGTRLRPAARPCPTRDRALPSPARDGTRRRTPRGS